MMQRISVNPAAEASKYMNVNAVCKLSKKCTSKETLESRLTQSVYYRIDIRNNPLTDNDLDCLQSLSHLEILNLSNTNIVGNCLPIILQIPSLQQLNIANNAALDPHLAVSVFLADPAPSQLEILNISGIAFDLMQLIGMIDRAFVLAKDRFKKLILGELTQLDIRELQMLQTTIQKLEAEYQIVDIIESSTLKQLAFYRSLL